MNYKASNTNQPKTEGQRLWNQCQPLVTTLMCESGCGNNLHWGCSFITDEWSASADRQVNLNVKGGIAHDRLHCGDTIYSGYLGAGAFSGDAYPMNMDEVPARAEEQDRSKNRHTTIED